jgi:hypothetical protein
LASIHTASLAVCSEPKNDSERLAYAKRVVATSDIIADATLVAKYDFKKRKPETFAIHKVFKGSPMHRIELWLPARGELLSNVGAPTSGKRVGSRMLIALTRLGNSFVIGECNARTIFDPYLEDTVKTLVRPKQEGPGDGR